MTPAPTKIERKVGQSFERKRQGTIKNIRYHASLLLGPLTITRLIDVSPGVLCLSLVLMGLQFQRSEVHSRNQGWLFSARPDRRPLLKGRLALLSPIDCHDDVLAYLPVVTPIYGLTTVHKVRDVTIMPSRSGVDYSAAWASENLPMPKQ
jgi:hypothetical protein